MRFDLFKVLDKEYVQDLLVGNLYMNTLEYFRKIEGNAAQNDVYEGICGTVQKNQLRQMGFQFDSAWTEIMGNNVVLFSNQFGLNNIFCLYCLEINEKTKEIVLPDKRIMDFNDSGSANKVVVQIKNTYEFIRRVDTAVEAALANKKYEYGIYGRVRYQSAWLNADGPGSRSAFQKEPKYAYQKEWRLCLLRLVRDKTAIKFSVGDLRDIVEVLEFEDFLYHIEKYYPGYHMTDDFGSDKETYKIIAGPNAVSHLMGSYMPAGLKKPHLSDEAMADWHYVQLLYLSGRPNEIGGYLEQRLTHTKIWIIWNCW